MLNNLFTLAISLLLALAVFVLPVPRGPWGKALRVVMLIAVYVFTALGTLWFFDARSALAILEFSLVLAGVSKLIALNFRMVHLARYPKDRRCY